MERDALWRGCFKERYDLLQRIICGKECFVDMRFFVEITDPDPLKKRMQNYRLGRKNK